MKISLNDAAFVNWEKVAESVREAAIKKIVEVTDEAMAALGKLKPGERKTFHIKLGSITISKPKE